MNPTEIKNDIRKLEAMTAGMPDGSQVHPTPKQSPADPIKELISCLKENNIGILFWTCPRGCNGQVEWTDKDKSHPVATCKVCGNTNTPPVQPAGEGKPKPKYSYIKVGDLEYHKAVEWLIKWGNHIPKDALPPEEFYKMQELRALLATKTKGKE